MAAVGLTVAIASTLLSELRRPRAEAPVERASDGDRPAVPRAAVALAAAQGLWWFGIQAAKMFVVLFFVHELAHVADVASPEGRAATERAVGLLAMTGVAGVLASFPVGWAASRWPRWRVAMGGLGAVFAAYAIAGFATDWTLGVPLSLLYGVGFATLQVLAYPLMLEAWPTARAGGLAALSNMLVAVPQVLAMLLMGGLIQLSGSYRMPFWIGAGAVACSAIALALYARWRNTPEVSQAPTLAA
jgi:MFS family permease